MIRFSGDNSLIHFPGRQVTMEEVRQLKMMKPGVNDERIMLEVGNVRIETIDICLFPYLEDENRSLPRIRWGGRHLFVGSNYDAVEDHITAILGADGCLNGLVTAGKDQDCWLSHDAGNERGLVWSIQQAKDFDYKLLLARWEELGKPTEVHASELLGVPRPKRSLRTLQPL